MFSINSSSGLLTRGLRALDREASSSHVLEVEAYNSDQGSMRSTVRVRRHRGRKRRVADGWVTETDTWTGGSFVLVSHADMFACLNVEW